MRFADCHIYAWDRPPAGPSVPALVDSRAEPVSTAMAAAFARHGTPCTCRVLTLARPGARLLDPAM